MKKTYLAIRVSSRFVLTIASGSRTLTNGSSNGNYQLGRRGFSRGIHWKTRWSFNIRMSLDNRVMKARKIQIISVSLVGRKRMLPIQTGRAYARAMHERNISSCTFCASTHIRIRCARAECSRRNNLLKWPRERARAWGCALLVVLCKPANAGASVRNGGMARANYSCKLPAAELFSRIYSRAIRNGYQD
jgi:hypothetical protein